MWKRLAILAIAITIVPVYAHQQTASQKHAQDGANPASHIVSPPGDQEASATRQQATQQDSKANVKVIAFPRKDWEDVATLCINFALAVAAFAGIGVGIWTLCYIRRQAREMQRQNKNIVRQSAILERQTKAAEDAAEAALLQAKHMEATERAWLLINFVSMKDRELKDGEVVTCRWAIKNVGATPAILLESKARFHAVRLYDEMPEDPVKTLPAIPDYGNPITINERLLAPQDSIGYFTKWERNVDGTFSDFAFPAQANEVWMVVAYGYVKYKDIFGGERESRSCDFTCIGRSDNIPMDFIPHPKVPAAYNRCT